MEKRDVRVPMLVRYSGSSTVHCSLYINYSLLQGSHPYWKYEKFFQSGKSQGILQFYQKVGEFCMSRGKVREN